MDEYERLEEELQRLYGLYVDKFRNLDYLESELDKYTKKEDEGIKMTNGMIEDWRKKQHPIYRD